MFHALEQRRQGFQRREKPDAAAGIAERGFGGAHVHAKVKTSGSPDGFEPGDGFDAPAPLVPYNTNLTSFNGIDPNGTWKLFVRDDTGGDAGQILNGWRLEVTTANPLIPVADLVISGTRYSSSWLARFAPLLGADAAYTADLDDDGLNNFEEWAFDLDP